MPTLAADRAVGVEPPYETAIAMIVYLAVFFVAARWPELRPYAASASNFCLGLNVVGMWPR